MLRVLCGLALPAMLLAPQVAFAQAEADPEAEAPARGDKGDAKPPAKKLDAPHKEGDYQGVKPGQSAFSPKKTKRPLLTWVGFEPREGGASRIFLQLNQDAEYDQHMDDKGVFHITLVGARYARRNTVRRLDTRFFDTPVSQVAIKKVGRARARGNWPAQRAGLRLSIDFKTPGDSQQPQISSSKGEDGYHYLYLGFTPAKERPEEKGSAAQDDLD